VHRKLLIVAMVVGTLFAGAAGGYLSGRSDAPAATFSSPGDASPSAATGIFPGATLNYVVSGVFHVPAEVPTGRYLITPTGSIIGCSWKRLTKNDDVPKHVIDAGTPNRGSHDEVVIGPADRYFVLLGDCTVQVETISP